MVTSPKTVNGEKCLSVVVYRTICQMHNSVYLFLSAVIFQIQAYSLCQTYVATTATIVCIVYTVQCAPYDRRKLMLMPVTNVDDEKFLNAPPTRMLKMF